MLAHGLTATRRYITHGSSALPRAGFRVVTYDARGHGESGPLSADAGFDYESLAGDLGEVIDRRAGGGPVLLAGHSMGVQTAARFALDRPEAVAGFVAIGPVSRGDEAPPDVLAQWDRLAAGLESGGVDGFLAAWEADSTADPAWIETLLRIARERMALHHYPEAIARALREVPRSTPFAGIESLGALEMPVLVVASHDDADPGHPYEIAQEWATTIPGARLISEERGESPLAWQGGKLSREISRFGADPGVTARY